MTKLVEDVGEGGGPVVTQVEERVSDSGGGVVFDAFGRFGLVALLALLVVAFSVLEPASFATADNYRSILDGQTPVVLLAMAALLPLVMGHFDLSVAANLGFAQVLVVGLIGYQDVPVAVAIPFALAASALVGLINGLLVVRLHLGSFIATLASGSILGGVQLWYTGGTTLFRELPSSFTQIGRGSLLGVPNRVVLTAIIILGLWMLLTHFPVGRKMYAVGANERAAVLAGIPTASYTLAVFVAAGLCAGVGGVLAGAQLGTAQAGGGDVLLIGGLTGALLSITTIQVGRYNVLGTAVAIYTLAIAITGFQQMGAPTWIQPVFNGVALIIALTASGWALRARAQRAKRTQLQLLTEGAGDYK